ncbi:MAG: hypothetical protein AMS27_02445 [Bacteroides sp. SM23_62_1]|nr:MAG: hypothetical protein AMS27_02445 [Bacteroides sp. SM23_62_1]
MQQFLRKYWKVFAFSMAGALVGFAYWRFVGCTGGSCPITSNWHTSTLMGGLLGFLVSGTGKKQNNEKPSE